MSEKKKRNCRMFTNYQAGVSLGELAAYYEVSKQAVFVIVQREGERQGVPLRAHQGPRHREPRVVVPPEILAALAAGSLTITAAARQCGCCFKTMQRAALRAGFDAAEARYRRRDALLDELLRRNEAGEYQREIAASLGKSPGVLFQMLRRHRLRHGLPMRPPGRPPRSRRRQKEAVT
jgi:hypothetical protein